MGKYTEAGLAKLRAIQEHYRNTPITVVPKTRITGGWAIKKATTDVFGNPLSEVSPRVQRIRDLQAGKRTAPLERRTMVWHEAVRTNPVRPLTINAQSPLAQETESYEDWTERMKSTMDKAADYMEDKQK